MCTFNLLQTQTGLYHPQTGLVTKLQLECLL